MVFSHFHGGVWVTAYARSNLLKNVCLLDDYAVYMDTDSIKLVKGYDKKIIDNYNEFVEKKIRYVSKTLNIDYNKFCPKDKDGVPHLLGVFDADGHYEDFVTQGAKKYCVTKLKKEKKVDFDNDNIIEVDEENKKYKVLEITVAGVPKAGAKALKKIEDFKDDLVFNFDVTGKNLLIYCDDMQPVALTDYLENTYTVTDKSGCCILPTTYVLGKSQDYTNFLTDNSSNRAVFVEEI